MRICALCVIILVRNKKTWANLALQEDKSIMKKLVALVMTALCLLAVGCSKQENSSAEHYRFSKNAFIESNPKINSVSAALL